jgi:hypothetical protein
MKIEIGDYVKIVACVTSVSAYEQDGEPEYVRVRVAYTSIYDVPMSSIVEKLSDEEAFLLKLEEPVRQSGTHSGASSGPSLSHHRKWRHY